MLELAFEVFMIEYEKMRKNRNEDSNRIHYLQEPNQFTLFLKSRERWEYFTIVLIQNLVDFGNRYDASREEAIKDFKTNFLHAAVPLKEKEAEVMNVPDDFVDNIEVITKRIAKEVETIDDEEAKDYVDFLRKKLRLWERMVLRFVDTTLDEEVISKFYPINKTFGEFLQRLFNRVNTIDFAKELRIIVRRNMKIGVDEAEEDIGMDIGFGIEFTNEVNRQTSRQLDGFHIGGTRWPGLKGVASELRDDITKIVLESVTERKSTKQIKEQIQDLFAKQIGDDSTEGRSMKIARTETNRFINASKLAAYVDSGVEGEKVWDSTLDNNTSDICERLNGQRQPLDKNFIDPLTGEQFEHPPALPNCRSVVRMIVTE